MSQPGQLRPVGKGVEAGRTWLYFHLLERKWKLCYGKDPESPSFLWDRERENLHGGWGGGWVDEGLGRENLVPCEEANSGSLLQWQPCPVGWGRGEEGRGPQVGGTEQRTSREEWVGGQKTEIFQEEQGRW